MKESKPKKENETEGKEKTYKTKSSVPESFFEKKFTNAADVEDWIQLKCSKKLYLLQDKAFVCRKSHRLGCTSRVTIYQDAMPGGVNHFRAKGSFFHSHDEPNHTFEYLTSYPWREWDIDELLTEGEEEFKKKRRERLEAREDLRIELKEDVTMPKKKM